MYTLEGLNDEYVKLIHENIILYSLKQYQALPEEIKTFYNSKYQNALTIKQEFNIEYEPELEDLKSFLQEQKEKVEIIKAQNQPIIDFLSSQILSILIKEMPNNLTEIEKCEYIFDFVTKTLEYSEDWYKYCKDIPPINGYEFTFYKGIPLSDNYKGLLITRQGICDDIANLIIYLGKELGVNINKAICEHNENLHAINYMEINGVRSYLDATSVIRKVKTKDEAFLVSEAVLNQYQDYKLKDHSISTTIDRTPVSYDIDKIIIETNKLMPQVNYLTYQKYEK